MSRLTYIIIIAIKEIDSHDYDSKDVSISSHKVALTTSKPTIYFNWVYISYLTKYKKILWIRFKTN